ncbi:MAG: hypothetical protein IPF51_10560 [Dehalococcoidia bacterium]|uniref:hypothetical protein n=1 Tax=Candidatus Amarobacter glycogenicus TaxID=3140699 RepID=UPI0031366C50|nr:hypothetical protein [Dehalococcoidia bacterium]
MAGTSVELALERHWDDFVKLIPWFALGVLAVALALVAYRPAARRIAIARVLACWSSLPQRLASKHIEENHKAGPFDYRYPKPGSRCPRPTMVEGGHEGSRPGAGARLGRPAQAALGIIAATVGHPAVRRR